MTEQLDGNNLELLTFRLQGHHYSLDIMGVRELREWTKTTPLPFSPPYMKGVINLRGTVLPVMDLAERLGLPEKRTSQRSVIIVVMYKDTMTGLIVDAVSDIVSVHENDLQAPPSSSSSLDNTMVKALTLIDENMIRILDLSQIVAVAQEDAA